jgi:hypothetical protein
VDEFSNPLTISFYYDPETLNGDNSVADQLSMCYFDESSQTMVEVETTIDEANHTISTTTDHLSEWTMFKLGIYTILGYGQEEVVANSEQFIIYFDEEANAPKFKDDTIRHTIYSFVSSVRTSLIDSYDLYLQAPSASVNGFMRLQNKTKVYIAPWNADGTAEWGWFSKNIEIPTTYSYLRDLEFEIAHELFHSIQNQYVNFYGMSQYRLYWYQSWFI